MASDHSKLFGKDFSLWLGARFASNMARRMISVAVAWQIYELTHNPLALGLIGLAEAIPFLTLSFWAGHLVDRHAKKPFMLGSEAAMLFSAVLLLTFTFAARVPVIVLYLIIGMTGAAVSFGSVASNVFVQMTVPREIFSRAAAWNLASYTIATITGPLLSGWIIAHSSGRGVYVLCVLLFLVSFGMMGGLRSLPAGHDEEESAITRVREGIRYVRSQPLILACMSLDMVAVLFGDAVALFPIFADMLHAGPFGYGLLRASPAAGSALISLVQAFRPFIHPSWKLLKQAVFIFGLCMIGFALSPYIALASLFLVFSGMVDGISVIIRQSVYQANTPDALRGRVAALSGIFISASNEIGAFESGLTARFIGPVLSVIFGGSVTLASVFVMGWKFRRIEEKV